MSPLHQLHCLLGRDFPGNLQDGFLSSTQLPKQQGLCTLESQESGWRRWPEMTGSIHLVQGWNKLYHSAPQKGFLTYCPETFMEELFTVSVGNLFQYLTTIMLQKVPSFFNQLFPAVIF